MEPEREELLVWLVRDDEPVEVVPRRVVVDEPSVFTVLVVVRAEPLELTREVVVVEAGDALRVAAEELVAWLVRLEEVVELVVLVELVEPEVLEVLELLELLEPLELLELLVLVCVVRLVELVELEAPVELEFLEALEVLEPLELLELLVLVCAVRLVEVRLVVVVVVVLEATRCCRSRALLIAEVRLVPEVFSLAIRLAKDCSGWRVS